jgi:hypothetical protein
MTWYDSFPPWEYPTVSQPALARLPPPTIRSNDPASGQVAQSQCQVKGNRHFRAILASQTVPIKRAYMVEPRRSSIPPWLSQSGADQV